MTFKCLYTLCVQEMLYICNTTKAQSSFPSEKTERPPKYKTSAGSLQQLTTAPTSKNGQRNEHNPKP